MFSCIKLIIGALALVGVSGVMACECGATGAATNGTVGQSSEMRTMRSPAADVSYSRSAGRGVSYESNAASIQTDASNSRTTARGVLNVPASSGGNITAGSGNGRGR